VYLRLSRRIAQPARLTSSIFGGVAVVTLTIFGADARAQSAAEPNSQVLPEVVVEPSKKKPKQKAAKKSGGPSAAASPAPQAQTAAAPQDVNDGESSTSPVYADPGPGVNLDVPNTTGSRLNMTPLQTPASVDIISGRTSRERGQNDVVEAVTQNAPGITSVAIPVLGTAFTSRGFQGNNSITRLYDGTRLYPGTGGTTSFPFNMWSVERIEVLHGPASVLYGDGAIGGVINVIPKKPITEGLINEAQIFFDSNGTRRASIDSGGAIDKNFAYRLNVTKDASEGWVDDGDSENLGISGALRFQASPDLVFSISHDYSEREPMKYFGVPYRDGVFDERTKENNYNVDNALARFRDEWTQAKVEWQASDAITFRNVAYRLDSRREFRNAEDYIWDTQADPEVIERGNGLHILQQQNQIGNRFDATIRTGALGVANETVLGFDVNRGKFNYANYGGAVISSVDPFDPEGGYFPDPGRLDPKFNSQLDQHSFFMEDRLILNEYVSLVGGVRWDTTTLSRDDLIDPTNGFEREFNSFNWRTGIVVTPLPGLAFYGQYAVGADPIDVPLLDYTQDISNLKQTTGRQYEIGVKQSLFGGTVEWSLSAYDIVKNDLLIRNVFVDFNTPPFIFTTLQQIGQQSSRGIEATIGVELGGGWRVDANGALLKARYDEFKYIDFSTLMMNDYAGKVPLLIPEETANVWVTWAFAAGWQAAAGVQYVGGSYENFANTVERPAYTIVNAALQWNPTDAVTLDFRVKNLFDRTYAQYLRTDPTVAVANDLQGYIAPPRTFEGALTVRF
jgi:iron complex outermembrane receptor protein